MEQIIDQAWFVLGGLFLVGSVWIAKWITRSIAESVVEAIGDTLAERWQQDMEAALSPIYHEVTANGGTSLKDKVLDVDQRLSEIEKQLEQEIIFNPDSDIGGTPI